MLMKSLVLLVPLILIFISRSSGQVEPNKSEEDSIKLEEKYRQLKDSSALLYPSVSAVSSVLVKKDQYEVNFYNSLYSANRFRDDDGDLNDYNFRETFFYSNLQVNYGISKDARLNVGMGLQYVLGRFDNDRNSSMFKVFGSDDEGNSL